MCVIWKCHDNVTRVSSFNLPRAFSVFILCDSTGYVTRKDQHATYFALSLRNAEIFRIEITRLQKNSHVPSFSSGSCEINCATPMEFRNRGIWIGH